MTRTPLTDGRWFDLAKATRYEEGRRWDGNNHVSLATGSQWNHEEIYRTASGRWVLREWSQWAGSGESFEEVSAEYAGQWFVKNELTPPAALRLEVGMLALDGPAPEPGWLDLRRATSALEALREELQRLATPGLPAAQSEALRDTLGALEQVERDLSDAAPPPGEHPGDSDPPEPGEEQPWRPSRWPGRDGEDLQAEEVPPAQDPPEPGEERPGNWCIADPTTRAHIEDLLDEEGGRPCCRCCARPFHVSCGAADGDLCSECRECGPSCQQGSSGEVGL